jgi:hypothetical protein
MDDGWGILGVWNCVGDGIGNSGCLERVVQADTHFSGYASMGDDMGNSGCLERR